MGKSGYVKLGLFVIVGSLLVAGGIVALGLRSYTEEPIYVETYFLESVQGLAVGSPVKQKGVQIGTVTEISFADFKYDIPPGERAGDRVVYVRMAVDPVFMHDPSGRDRRQLIREAVGAGLRTRLVAQGITGLVSVNVDRADPRQSPPMEISWQPRDLYVPSTESTGERVIKSVEEILGSLGEVDFKSMGRNLNALLVTVDEAVAGAEVDRRSQEIGVLVTESTATMRRRVREILEKPEVDSIAADAKETMANLRKASERLEPVLTTLGEDLKATSTAVRDLAKRVDEVLASEEFRRTLAEAPGAVAHLHRLLKRLDRIVAANEETVDGVLRNIRRITEQVDRVTANAEEYPAQVLFGEPPPPTELKEGDR